MKRTAFTMIELVFVIVVIGIISAVMIPRMERDTLSEAAIQLASHLRYTQHLAMVDDKYVPSPDMSNENTVNRKDKNSQHWFRERWQLVFGVSNDTNNKIAYTIFSDKLGTGDIYSGQPDEREIARNPLDPNKVLSGGYSGTVNYKDAIATSALNLGEKFSILDYKLSGGCSWSRISFDHLGRPYKGDLSNYGSWTTAYQGNKLMTSLCSITICDVSDCDSATDENKRVITIQPETGYVSIK